MGFAADLIAECLVLQGHDPRAARKAAEDVMGIALAAGIVPPRHLEAWERGAKVYHLRSQRMAVIDLTERFEMVERTIFRLFRKHLANRRAAIRKAS